MTSLLEKRLADEQFLIADGGMGTSLFARGLESGASPELWNIDEPDIIEDVHREFVDAGADIILTNTFGGNRERLALHGAQDRVAEVNKAAAAIARRAGQGFGRPIIVAGSIGPTGSLLEPLGPLTIADAEDIFAEQAQALAAGGVDVLWIETMSALEELGAAVLASAGLGLPIVATMSFDTKGHTMMGVAPGQFLEWWRSAEHRPFAIGANCGLGPGEAVLAAMEMASGEPTVVAKGNCGIPQFVGTELHYPSDPAKMDDYAQLALAGGARIVGACCGSTPEHIRRIRKSADSYEGAPAPTSEEISDRLGLEDPRPSPLNPNVKRRRRRS